MENVDNAKELAAQKSLEFIENDMVVGLGSGSTATHFIKLLGERVKQGLKVRGIASSQASTELAESLSIPMTNFQQVAEIDVTIDGADEVGPGLSLIKGGGGALLREKIVASASRKFVVVADTRKCVHQLGTFPLPVEVIQMASPLVMKKLIDLDLHPSLRRLPNGSEYITDEGNFILDCKAVAIPHPEDLAAKIRAIVGVVEHGLFLNMANLAIVANDTDVYELTPSTSIDAYKTEGARGRA